MDKKFKINGTKITGDCQSRRKVAPQDSKSDLPLEDQAAYIQITPPQFCDPKRWFLCELVIAMIMHAKYGFEAHVQQEETPMCASAHIVIFGEEPHNQLIIANYSTYIYYAPF